MKKHLITLGLTVGLSLNVFALNYQAVFSSNLERDFGADYEGLEYNALADPSPHLPVNLYGGAVFKNNNANYNSQGWQTSKGNLQGVNKSLYGYIGWLGKGATAWLRVDIPKEGNYRLNIAADYCRRTLYITKQDEVARDKYFPMTFAAGQDRAGILPVNSFGLGSSFATLHLRKGVNWFGLDNGGDWAPDIYFVGVTEAP